MKIINKNQKSIIELTFKNILIIITLLSGGDSLVLNLNLMEDLQ